MRYLTFFMLINVCLLSNAFGHVLNTSTQQQLLWTYELPSNYTRGPVDILVQGTYYFTKEKLGERYFVRLHSRITRIEFQSKFGTLRYRLNGQDYRQDQVNATDGLGMQGFDQVNVTSILASIEVQFLNNSKLGYIGDNIAYEVGDIDKYGDLNKLMLNLAGSKLKNINWQGSQSLESRINNLNKPKPAQNNPVKKELPSLPSTSSSSSSSGNQSSSATTKSQSNSNSSRSSTSSSSTSSKSSTNANSSQSNNSNEDQPMPIFGNKSMQQLTQERDDAVVNLVKTTVNTLDFFLSEARENSIRKAQQRQIEYQRAEEERLKREAEESVNKKNAINDIEYYLAKAEAGDDFAMEKVASAYLTLKNEDKATIWYEKATNSGSANACSMLMYLKENKNSDLYKKHTAESLKWLPRQIELGDFSIAMLNISISYGSKSSKWYEPKKAITLYKQLAELGCAEAMFKLGETLTGGNKYEINKKKNFDVEEGIKWLKLCSEFEDSEWSPKALEEISEIYREGRLIKKNKEKADEYALAAKELQEKLGYVFYMYAIITSEDNGFAIVTKLLTCHSRTGEYGRSSTDEARIAKSRFADYIKNKNWEEFINNTKFNYSIEMINWSDQYDINKKRLEDVRKRVSSGQKVVIKEVDFSYNKRQK